MSVTIVIVNASTSTLSGPCVNLISSRLEMLELFTAKSPQKACT